MKHTIWLSMAFLFFIINCQNTTGQEIGSGNIKIILEKKIEFIDYDVDTVIRAVAFAHIDFNDSLPLKPVKVLITRISMKELRENTKKDKVYFHAFFINTEEDSLNDFEKKLLEKYLPKIDSIYMNSRYEFVGKEEYNRRMGIGFSFKIKPGVRCLPKATKRSLDGN
ncbi:MAG: hypothetical protein PHI32_11680 [Dysgonamonadaceae bacterium]|nr:hypothetical protein [Dysgonamonadaceae bacterium]MDD4727444.1 hypothetical protein [Dysgonamonadaceae bacterium]